MYRIGHQKARERRVGRQRPQEAHPLAAASKIGDLFRRVEARTPSDRVLPALFDELYLWLLRSHMDRRVIRMLIRQTDFTKMQILK